MMVSNEGGPRRYLYSDSKQFRGSPKDEEDPDCKLSRSFNSGLLKTKEDQTVGSEELRALDLSLSRGFRINRPTEEWSLNLSMDKRFYSRHVGISEGDINKNESPKVWRTWDDGYSVRAMVPSDAAIVQKWYMGMGKVSRADLDVCLEVYPPGPGFYVGEKDGEVIASAIRIPWGDGVYYGSYYYVEERFRRGGYGTRLRDEVAREHVGESILCVDAVQGKVTENNKTKFGYVQAFTTGRFEGVAKEDYGVNYAGRIVSASEVSFDSIIEYDNKCFVSKDFPPRRAFMAKWIALPQGATYVALDEKGTIIGLCCRRICVQEGNHTVGPVYADSTEIAEALLQRSCRDVVGDMVSINLWYPNEEAVNMVKKFGMTKVFDVNRMHINGDPKELKETVFGLTSIDVCGF